MGLAASTQNSEQFREHKTPKYTVWHPWTAGVDLLFVLVCCCFDTAVHYRHQMPPSKDICPLMLPISPKLKYMSLSIPTRWALGIVLTAIRTCKKQACQSVIIEVHTVHMMAVRRTTLICNNNEPHHNFFLWFLELKTCLLHVITDLPPHSTFYQNHGSIYCYTYYIVQKIRHTQCKFLQHLSVSVLATWGAIWLEVLSKVGRELWTLRSSAQNVGVALHSSWPLLLSP